MSEMFQEWPNLLADLKAKRAALDQVITTIETHFFPVDGAMPESPMNGARIRAADHHAESRRLAGGPGAEIMMPEPDYRVDLGCAVLAPKRAHNAGVWAA